MSETEPMPQEDQDEVNSNRPETLGEVEKAFQDSLEEAEKLGKTDPENPDTN